MVKYYHEAVHHAISTMLQATVQNSLNWNVRPIGGELRLVRLHAIEVGSKFATESRGPNVGVNTSKNRLAGPTLM